jgi:hypothetical protein
MNNVIKRYYLIDHRILFFFGYVFYLFIPYLVGVTNAFSGYPGMELYQGFFRLIPKGKLLQYMLVTLSWLPAFYLGHLSFKLFVRHKRSLQLFPANPTTRAVSYVGLLLLLVLVVFAYLGRASLLGGYGSYDVAARGKMSTLLVIFNFFLLYQLLSAQKPSFFLVTGTMLTAMLLLSMGGRMYVMQTFLIYLIYKTSFAARRWQLSRIALVLLAGFLVGSFMGLWRMNTSFKWDRAAYSLLAEPVFTWFSTSTYLISNDIPVVSIPWNFLTSFLNLIPNTIISLKPYLVSTGSMVKNYQNPLGADSVWSTVVINFGSAGSFLFIFITGFMLNLLRHFSERSRFWAVYYICVCGMLPFQFFRDGFYIIHKQLYFNFLLFPAIILFVLKTMLLLQANYKAPLNKPHLY